MFQQLHREIKGGNFSGSIETHIVIHNGVKQGDIPTATLFPRFFTMTLGVFLNFRPTINVFDSIRFNAKSKTFQSVFQELFYADIAVFLADTEKNMHSII